jgi:quinol-cytochrome oxidoreductase complex cytochrome b subunit
MNPEIPLNRAGSPYQDTNSLQAPVLSVKDWVIIFIIGAIPIVNLVMLFVWGFGGNANPNKKNYAKAALIIAAIFIVIYIVFLVLFLVIFGAAGMSNGMFSDFQ